MTRRPLRTKHRAVIVDVDSLMTEATLEAAATFLTTETHVRQPKENLADLGTLGPRLAMSR